MIPKDPVMLLSFVNLKLRDFYKDLDSMCEDLDADKDEIVQKPVGADDVYRQVGRGDSATIKNVKSSSLRDLK